MTRPIDLEWLLHRFIAETPHTRGALVASSDGVKTQSHNIGADDTDRLSAVVTGMFSLAKGVGQMAGLNAGRAKQVIVELEGCHLYVMEAGPGALLAVLAEKDGDPGRIGHEMGVLVTSVAPFLSTPVRAGLAATGTTG
nr:roadblock/LC7 domain-containing protein [Kitasatospora purpeofusca]